jgi:hypothetical protein
MSDQPMYRRRRRRHLHRCLHSRRGSGQVFRQGAPPAARPVGRLCRRHLPAGSRPFRRFDGRPRHHGGTNALLGAQGRADRRHHHGRVSRRAGDAPPRPAPHLGPARDRFHPVVPRDLRLEVPERVLADGTVLESRRSRRRQGARRRARRRRLRGRRVFFANAYANPENEARAVEAVRAVWPNAYVTAATEILPEIREFERLRPRSTPICSRSSRPISTGWKSALRPRAGWRRYS